MTTHTTTKGHTIQIDGNAVTITTVRGVTTGTIEPGLYLELIPASATELYAAAAKKGITQLYGWWEGKVFDQEIAAVLNAAIAAITPQPTAAELELQTINAKRSRMVADIERGLRGPDSEAAADCYDIDMRRVEYWYAKQIAAWEAKYPAVAEANAKAAHVARVNADIADLESRAKDALVYDADGWISSEEQQRRHDEYMAQAVALRRSLNATTAPQ